MSRILVSYATDSGITKAVATDLGAELERLGHDVLVNPCRIAPPSYAFDVVVTGSSLQHGHWLPDAMRYLKAEAPDLAERPTWLFQIGPCADGEQEGHVGAAPVPDRVVRYARDIGAAGPATFSPPDESTAAGSRPTWVGTGPCFGPFGEDDGIGAWAAVISSWAGRHAPASAASGGPGGAEPISRDSALAELQPAP